MKKSETKILPCLSGFSVNCLKEFRTTSEYRICSPCRELVNRNQGGYDSVPNLTDRSADCDGNRRIMKRGKA